MRAAVERLAVQVAAAGGAGQQIEQMTRLTGQDDPSLRSVTHSVIQVGKRAGCKRDWAQSSARTTEIRAQFSAQTTKIGHTFTRERPKFGHNPAR